MYIKLLVGKIGPYSPEKSNFSELNERPIFKHEYEDIESSKIILPTEIYRLIIDKNYTQIITIRNTEGEFLNIRVIDNPMVIEFAGYISLLIYQLSAICEVITLNDPNSFGSSYLLLQIQQLMNIRKLLDLYSQLYVSQDNSYVTYLEIEEL